MTLCRSIVAHGRDAVLAYRRMCGSAADNEAPEVFLSSYIARGLHADLNVADMSSDIMRRLPPSLA